MMGCVLVWIYLAAVPEVFGGGGGAWAGVTMVCVGGFTMVWVWEGVFETPLKHKEPCSTVGKRMHKQASLSYSIDTHTTTHHKTHTTNQPLACLFASTRTSHAPCTHPVSSQLHSCTALLTAWQTLQAAPGVPPLPDPCVWG